MSEITVIIATYNRCDSLKNTLDSLLNQEGSNDFSYEVIVVDNNSNDNTKEVVESYMKIFGRKLKYLFEPRQGKSFALNKGILNATGKVFVFTDDDCVVDKQWLQNTLDIFRKHNDIDLLTGKIIPQFEIEKPEWLDLDIFRGVIGYHNQGDRYIEGKDGITCVGANMAGLRKSFEKFGGFSLAGRGEEIELYYRWRKMGAKFAYSPDVLVYHFTSKSMLEKKYLRKWFFLAGKNYTLIYQKECTSGRKLLGISLWIYKKTLLALTKFFKDIFSFKKSGFIKEFELIYCIGLFWGLSGFKTNFENLR